MTDYIIIGLLAFIAVLAVIILARLFSLGNSSEELHQLRREMTSSVNESIASLGSAVSQNQSAAANMQTQQLTQIENRLRSFELSNNQRLDDVRKTMDERLDSIRRDNNRELEKIRGTVDEKLQKTLEDTMTQSFKMVSERLEQVYKGLGEMQSIANDVGGLKKVLSNVKTRGILGEIQLGAILSDILAPEQYAENVAVVPGSKNRVEYAVKLPGEDGEPVWLPIDSKFPGDTYSELQDAYDSCDRARIDAAVNALIRTVKSEAKEISKYISPPHTTNFAIMFLPFEGLYAEVVNRGLVETLQKDYRINIAGPSTMAALLNSLQMGFRTLAIQKQSAEVWKVLGAVKTEFGRFEDIIKSTQNKLDMAHNELEKLVGTRTRAINRTLRNVEKLDGASAAALIDESLDVSDE